MPETTTGLIAQIRQDIATGRVPTAEVLRLCDRAEELLSSTLAIERELHNAIKIIEKA